MMPFSARKPLLPLQAMGFANVNFDAIVPENSVTKVYNSLVESGQIKSDPKQLAVIGLLQKWQDNFTKHEPRLQEF